MVTEQEVDAIGQTLVDPQQPLQARFRALFTLRGLGGPGAIAWISRAFSDDSALLKHELAYCLGQMQDRRAVPVLVDVLRDTRQEPMVRHEAGEWRGEAVGTLLLLVSTPTNAWSKPRLSRPPQRVVSIFSPAGQPGCGHDAALPLYPKSHHKPESARGCSHMPVKLCGC